MLGWSPCGKVFLCLPLDRQTDTCSRPRLATSSSSSSPPSSLRNPRRRTHALSHTRTRTHRDDPVTTDRWPPAAAIHAAVTQSKSGRDHVDGLNKVGIMDHTDAPFYILYIVVLLHQWTSLYCSAIQSYVVVVVVGVKYFRQCAGPMKGGGGAESLAVEFETDNLSSVYILCLFSQRSSI